ncbi:FliM/FliN family flagellar motor switch protein [Burkholderia perseverans]|uniref:FliM/FliN family flagellar motor switch protein n=1 Tax=Burkholderia perseverans TaxID=2615214 RepID=UPI001FEF4EF3|nr:FliM/FliN family flagellar motor switch protein [Burkholderia perseverans]
MTTHTFPKQAVAAHVDFPEQQAGAHAEPAEPAARPMLDLLDGVKVNVDVVLGRSVLDVKDMMALQSGSVLELKQAIGDPVEVVLNGRTIATGEIVAVDGHFGVRIVEIGAGGR